MNFLAHSYLSGNDDKILLGNFIADAVKGNRYNDYEDNIRFGILLHRKIDEFTDKHECFIQSKHRLSDTYHKFSGIIIDIFYDHFLSKYWNEYSDLDLLEFSSHIYDILVNNYKLIPARFRRILPYLVYDNWLIGYSKLESLKRVFAGMDRRTGGLSGMRNAVDDLEKDYSEYENDFRMFFPGLITMASDILENGIKNGQQEFVAQKKIDSLLNG
jgi:acyl carrier protein phosphodiesterase